MKITIDNIYKTIEIEGECSIEEFIQFIKQYDLKKDEYKIIGTRTMWQYYPYYPVSIPYQNPVNPIDPTYEPYKVTCTYKTT